MYNDSIVNVPYHSNVNHKINIEVALNKKSYKMFFPVCSCGWNGLIFDSTPVDAFITNDDLYEIAKEYGVSQLNYYENSRNNSSIGDLVVSVGDKDLAEKMAVKQALEHINYDKEFDSNFVQSRVSYLSNEINPLDDESTSLYKIRQLTEGFKELNDSENRSQIWDTVEILGKDVPNAFVQKRISSLLGE